MKTKQFGVEYLVETGQGLVTLNKKQIIESNNLFKKIVEFYQNKTSLIVKGKIWLFQLYLSIYYFIILMFESGSNISVQDNLTEILQEDWHSFPKLTSKPNSK